MQNTTLISLFISAGIYHGQCIFYISVVELKSSCASKRSANTNSDTANQNGDITLTDRNMTVNQSDLIDAFSCLNLIFIVRTEQVFSASDTQYQPSGPCYWQDNFH